MMILRQAKQALETLNKSGYSAYLVGGCVRDSLLFNEHNCSDSSKFETQLPEDKIKDWDITTSALPEQIIECFSEYKTIETGLKYGTVTVIIDKLPLEITTYRIDGEYKDSRHPSEVLFTDRLKDDLSRRDFTINAIAYNNEITDYFGGISDIESRLIRTVGDSDKRFSEDALRILRAVRFSSQLGFKVEENTKISIMKNKKLLKNISAERINAELKKLLTGENFYNVLLEYKEIIFEIVPELTEINENLKNSENDLIIRLALLFWDIREQKKVLKNLKFDNNTIDILSIITENKNRRITETKPEIKKLLNKMGEQALRYLMKIRKTDEGILEICKNECYSLKTLALNGNDLKKIGVTDGKRIGEILNEMLGLVIEEKLDNKMEILLKYIVTNQ